jgi:hypothetical protein
MMRSHSIRATIDTWSAGDTPVADESGGLSVHKAGIAVAVSLIGQIRDMMQAIMDSQKTMANYAATEQILSPGPQGRHLLQAKGRLLNRCSMHSAGTPVHGACALPTWVGAMQLHLF